MKLIKPETRTYAEIGQQIDIKFAFCTKKEDTITQLFDWVKCRDFLGDCLHSRDIKGSFLIYRFKFDYTETPLDENYTKLLVKIPKKYINNIKENLHYLFKIEDQGNLLFSSLVHVEDDIYYLEGDVFWQKTTQLLSFYTLAIKCLAVEHKDSLWDNMPEYSNEEKYINQISKELPTFLANFKKVFKNPEYNSSGYNNNGVDALHNNSGIMTFLNKDYDNLAWKLNNNYYKEYLKCQEQST